MPKSLNLQGALDKIAQKYDTRILNKQNNLARIQGDIDVLIAERVALEQAVREYWDAENALAAIQAKIAAGEPVI